MSDTPEIGPFVQAAYLVADAEAAARRWAREFGAGPFFLLQHIPLENVFHRGAPATLDHTAAFGQLGSIMIELIQQLSRERGLTVLLSSHLLHQAQRICDRVGIMIKGRMVAHGPMAVLAQEKLGIGTEEYTLEEIYMKYFKEA